MKSVTRIVALLVAVLTLMASMSMTLAAAKPSIANDFEWELIKLTNNERKKKGLKPLSANEAMQWRMDVRADELSRYFSHTRPDGSSCMTVFDGIKNVNHFGENVAAGYPTPADTIKEWMNSNNGHKENILYGGFSHIGIGYKKVENGYYGCYWAQGFVGDCDVTAMSCDITPVFDTTGKLLTTNATLILSCCHGTSYLPLVNATYSIGSKYYGKTTMTVKHDGKSYYMGAVVGYSDVYKGAWYYNDVLKAVDRELLFGTSTTKFEPYGNMTRAMLVEILYRMEGNPTVALYKSFTDVKSGNWYADSVSWAARKGVVAGITKTKFGPNQSITRQQIIAILYRYANMKGVNTKARKSLSNFTDYSKVSSYAKVPLQWANALGLLESKTGGKLQPAGNVTRGEICGILVGYLDFAE